MQAPHRKTPNRLRELRERVQQLVRQRIGPGLICGRCGANYLTYSDKCEAGLNERCPGGNAIDRVRLIVEREVGIGL